MKKRILISLAMIAAAAAVVSSGTLALFSDTETSNGNIFTAGAIDLKVDHAYASYNGEECNDCVVPEGADNLVDNGGFEDPALGGGQWQVFPSISGWTGEGAGIEVQNNAAGAPHSGSQHVELDSHGLADSRSAMYQDIVTVPGQKYRLSFWHMHRPGNTPADDNYTQVHVTVVSDSGTLINQTVGSDGSAAWKEYTFDFVALDNSTQVKFIDAGSQPDTLGAYLDDVAVYGLECPTDNYSFGGTCTLWAEKDLVEGDKFWNFTDVKPGDWGKNVISLHVYSNDAYACLLPSNVQDLENVLTNPEEEANDTTDDPTPGAGELAEALEFFMWNDADADNVFDSATEDVIAEAGTLFSNLSTQDALDLQSPAPVTLLGVMWCAGDQTRSGDVVSCDGSGMGNVVQTDKVVADFVAYAVQQRNNGDFSCEDVEVDDEEEVQAP